MRCEMKIASTAVAVAGAYVQITVPDVTLEYEDRYLLVLAQPVPVAGYNLPVQIVINGTAYPMQRYGYGNILYGEDLPKRRTRLPLYYNNAGEFVDTRNCY